MRALGTGRIAMALGLAGLAVLSLYYGDFALQWQPVPAWFPWRHGLAYASGAFLLVACIGVLSDRFGAPSALALTVYQLIWVVVRATTPLRGWASIGRWIGVAEGLMQLVGAWLLWSSLVPSGTASLAFLRGKGAMRVARILFGVSCLELGLSHFAYADFTANMIPQVFPQRLWLAHLTGVCHLAAGVGLLTTVFARLAATLEAAMIGSFVLLVHVPSLFASPAPRWAPTPQIQWTELFVAMVLGASTAVLARALQDRPWGLRVPRTEVVGHIALR
jgi:uncharacterized membrane protein